MPASLSVNPPAPRDAAPSGDAPRTRDAARSRELILAAAERLFAAREAAVRPAAEPLERWAADGCPGGRDGLRAALDQAAEGYLAFLAAHPSFVALVQREALAGGRRLSEAPHASTSIEDALTAVRRGGAAVVKPFDVAEALTAFVALCFFPLAHAATFTAAGPVDLDARRRQVVDVMLHLLT